VAKRAQEKLLRGEDSDEDPVSEDEVEIPDPNPGPPTQKRRDAVRQRRRWARRPRESPPYRR
jgi:hypothetical protein